MINYKNIANQSLLDIALQTAGNVDAVFELMQANNYQFDFSASVPVGTELVIPDYSTLKNDVLQYFTKNNTQIATDVIIPAEWILTYGYWNDYNSWLDSATWIDLPNIWLMQSIWRDSAWWLDDFTWTD
jgi:hypothetical protein